MSCLLNTASQLGTVVMLTNSAPGFQIFFNTFFNFFGQYFWVLKCFLQIEIDICFRLDRGELPAVFSGLVAASRFQEYCFFCHQNLSKKLASKILQFAIFIFLGEFPCFPKPIGSLMATFKIDCLRREVKIIFLKVLNCLNFVFKFVLFFEAKGFRNIISVGDGAIERQVKIKKKKIF